MMVNRRAAKVIGEINFRHFLHTRHLLSMILKLTGKIVPKRRECPNRPEYFGPPPKWRYVRRMVIPFYPGNQNYSYKDGVFDLARAGIFGDLAIAR